MLNPVRGSPLDSLEQLEIFGIELQPLRERRPLPKQAFVCDLDDVGSGATISDKQPRLDQSLHHGALARCELLELSHAPHGRTALGIDPCQPGNERRTQAGQLRILGGRDRGSIGRPAQRPLERHVDRAGYAAHGIVLLRREAAAGRIFLIKV